MSDTNNLRARIAEELNRQPSDIIGTPSLSMGYVINREINSAIQHYESNRFRWNEVREDEFATTTQGQRTYSLPATFISMDTLKVIDSDYYVLCTKRTWGYIENQDRDIDTAEGTPDSYAFYGNVLRVYPVPNDALTLVGSYIQRFPPTSLTGSFCSVITMGGGSFTATATASHNNRLNGWYTDGEALIRHRAVATIEINYLKNIDFITEKRQLSAMNKPFLSINEMNAYDRLIDETKDFQSTGTVRPYEI